MKKYGFLFAFWVSGFFSAASCIYLVRLLMCTHVVVNGIALPASFSAAILSVSAPLAVIFALVGIYSYRK